MKLKLERKYFKKYYTIGALFIDDIFFCDTLEDTVRNLPTEVKIYGETAIPKGTYKVAMRRSAHFKRILPHIENVPYFTEIMIHGGNTQRDTLGCILVGRNTSPGTLTSSRYFSDLLNSRLKDQRDVTIEIV